MPFCTPSPEGRAAAVLEASSPSRCWPLPVAVMASEIAMLYVPAPSGEANVSVAVIVGALYAKLNGIAVAPRLTPMLAAETLTGSLKLIVTDDGPEPAAMDAPGRGESDTIFGGPTVYVPCVLP